ncbi:hypothetical protein EMPS_08226 [Entomortierella parvispora]|uniref:Uncharacterized protein n=1 Tax=Entomortierella parvispora TaxID=205924 RepID=A0A9P3HFZ8_9FUNG|nr:hypothetical protein EMPS_08226 [Entomortierella parvispora]
MRPTRGRKPAIRTATVADDNTTTSTATPSARSTRLSRRNQPNENNERRVANTEDNQSKNRISSSPTLDSDKPKSTKNKKDIGFTIIIPYKPFPRKLTQSSVTQPKASIVSEDDRGDETVETKPTRTRRGARRIEEKSHIPCSGDEVDDIEYPRQQVQRMEAVVLFEKPRILRKPTPSSNAILEQKLEKMTEESAPATISAIAEDITAAASEGLDVGSFSRLSITPPPSLPLFDLKDPDGSGSPWLMVFDSSEHSASSRPSQLQESWNDENTSPAPDSPSSPTRHHYTRHHSEIARDQSEYPASATSSKTENHGWMDEDHDTSESGDKGEDDDDPFGFSKVERRIKRAQILQPISRSRTPLDPDDDFSTGIDIVNPFNPPRPRRRGETRNKGKGVDRTWFLTKDPLHPDTTASEPKGGSEDLRKAIELSKADTTSMNEKEQEDLKKALQLSMGVDLDSGVGTSSMAALLSRPETALVREVASSGAMSRAETNVATRSIRSPSPESEPEDLFAVTEPCTTRTRSPAPPSTPPRKSRSNHNRISFGDIDELPIVIERTPTKKPEAGMPASMESPSSKDGRGGKAGKTKRTYMRTEQLEALLPRRKKARVVTTNSKSAAIRLDASDDEDEDEEEDEEDEEPLLRQGRTRQLTKAASTTSVAPPKQTRAKAASYKNTAKSTTLKQTSDKKGKGRSEDSDHIKQQSGEDKSGWTEAQRKAHEERILYFAEIDNFELDVETTR